jgi:hypothetical protein
LDLEVADPSISKITPFDMPPLEVARTSEAVTRSPEDLTKAPSEGGKLEDEARIRSEIARGV